MDTDAESSDETKEDEKVKKEIKGCMSEPELFVIDSSDDENGNNEKPCYYSISMISMPVYQFGKYSPTYPDFLNILVESPDLNLICTKLSSLVEEYIAFVLSTKKSDITLLDIQCDSHTGWVNDG